MTQQTNINSISSFINQLENDKIAKGDYDPKKKGKDDMENAILFSIILLMESVSITTKSEVVKAKELQANAAAQEELDEALNALKWFDVPNKQFTSKEEAGPNFRSWWDRVGWSAGQTQDLPGFLIFQKFFDHHKEKIEVNMGSIASAQEQNCYEEGERQKDNEQLGVLRQTAQTNMTAQNTKMNDSNTSTKEASALLNILQSLTNRILNVKNHR